MYRLLKAQRIRRSRDFERFRSRAARSLHEGIFILKVIPTEDNGLDALDLPRIGIVTSRKVGCAVERNRVRRVVREVFRKNPDVFHGKHDYLFIALKGIAEHANGNIEQALLNAAKKLNCIVAKKNLEKIYEQTIGS